MSGSKALMYAREHGHRSVVKALQEYSAKNQERARNHQPQL